MTIERDAALSETAHTIAGLLRVAHLTYTHGRPAGESTRALQQRQAERLVRLQQPGAMTRAETAAHLAVRHHLDAYIRGVRDTDTTNQHRDVIGQLLLLRDSLSRGLVEVALGAFNSSLQAPNLCACGQPWDTTTDVLSGQCEACRIRAAVSEVA